MVNSRHFEQMESTNYAHFIFGNFKIFFKIYSFFIFLIFVLKFFVALTISGVVQMACGIVSIAYMRIMPMPLREYMADNLRSNYTGGFGVGYLERQYDKSVDWVQINVKNKIKINL